MKLDFIGAPWRHTMGVVFCFVAIDVIFISVMWRFLFLWQNLSCMYSKVSPEPEYTKLWRSFSGEPLSDEQIVVKIYQQAAAECGQNLTWSREQAAAAVISMRSLTDLLHKHLQKGRKRNKTRIVMPLYVWFRLSFASSPSARHQKYFSFFQAERK